MPLICANLDAIDFTGDSTSPSPAALASAAAVLSPTAVELAATVLFLRPARASNAPIYVEGTSKLLRL